MVTCNKILLAITHSFNLIIYCLSSKSFRTTVYESLIGTQPEPKTTATLQDAFRGAAECILHVQKLMEQEEEQFVITRRRRRTSITHVILQDGTSFLMRRRGVLDHPLAYLDLAVACKCKNDHSEKSFLANKRNLRFQKMIETKNTFKIDFISNISLYWN